ncbi:MAG: hypothetical protein WD904_00325 [Dehalococcoidia bacterium]
MRLTALAALLVLALSAALFLTLRDDSEAAWLGQNGRIIFHNEGAPSGIYIVDADGSDLSPIVPPGDSLFYPSWSPDGETIVYQRGSGGLPASNSFGEVTPAGATSINITDADGSFDTSIAIGFQPSWTNDGSQILFVKNGDIWIMDADGNNEQAIAVTPELEYFPVMSPNGSTIVFSALTTTQTVSESGPAGPIPYELFSMNVNGTNVQQITNVASSYVPIPADWAPDSSKVAFWAGNLFTVVPGQMPVDIGIDQVTPDPSWSPNGNLLAISFYHENGACVSDRLPYEIQTLVPGTSDLTFVAGDFAKCEPPSTEYDQFRHPDWEPVASPATPTASPTASATASPTAAASPSGSVTPTATASATATVSAAPTSPGETAAPTDTPGPTPVIKDVVWGDDQCDEETNPVDSLVTLRFDAGLSTNTGDCPPMNHDITIVEVLPAGLGGESPAGKWGDVDCDAETNPIDSLKILRYDAGLDSGQDEPCPPIGAELRISYFP